MTTSALDIVRAAVDAAAAKLEAEGLAREVPRLPRLFAEVLGDRDQTVFATLVTPDGKAGALKDSIVAALEKKLGRRVELREKADPSLIGGARIEFGDERIDLSVRHALDAAAASLETPSARS